MNPESSKTPETDAARVRVEEDFISGESLGMESIQDPDGRWIEYSVCERIELQRNEARQILKELLSNPHLDLGDLVYQVREREGEGWDGPAVTAWSNAVEAAQKLIASVEGGGE